MILQFIFKAYGLTYNKFIEPLGYVIGRFYLYGSGISFGKKVRIYGLPTISIFKDSVFIIGDNAVLRSKSRGNAIGVNHEIILRTYAPTARIIIGDNFGMSGGAICAVNKVEIGNNVLIGANVVIADNDFHGICLASRKIQARLLPSKPILIEDGVWLGADVYVCKGVKIGKNSVIGAKSVVTKSIPENCIAVGVPAKVIGTIDNA